MLLCVDNKYLSDFVNMKSELRKFSPCLVQFCNAVLQCRFAMQFCNAGLQYSFEKQRNGSIFGPYFNPPKCFLGSVNCCKFQMGL